MGGCTQYFFEDLKENTKNISTAKIISITFILMSFLNSNIRYLRRLRGMTQADLAGQIGIKRSLLGAYEEERAEPRIATMQKLSYFFEIPLDTLINQDLSNPGAIASVDTEGRTLRVLPIVTDSENKEKLTLVPVTAEAGYADSYADPEYIETLPSFSLPVQELYPDQSYRLFQIQGESMLPIPSGSYVICAYVQNWHEVKDGACYVVVTQDRGIVYKRLWSRLEEEGTFLLKSDNPLFEPYTLEATQILEIWHALGFLSFELPEQKAASVSDVQQIGALLAQLHQDVEGLKQKVDVLSE